MPGADARAMLAEELKLRHKFLKFWFGHLRRSLGLAKKIATFRDRQGLSSMTGAEVSLLLSLAQPAKQECSGTKTASQPQLPVALWWWLMWPFEVVRRKIRIEVSKLLENGVSHANAVAGVGADQPVRRVRVTKPCGVCSKRCKHSCRVIGGDGSCATSVFHHMYDVTLVYPSALTVAKLNGKLAFRFGS